MTDTIEHTPESAAGEALVAGIETVASLQQQLAECRAERDGLREACRQVRAWMRKANSTLAFPTPMADVIKLLEAALEPTK